MVICSAIHRSEVYTLDQYLPSHLIRGDLWCLCQPSSLMSYIRCFVLTLLSDDSEYIVLIESFTHNWNYVSCIDTCRDIDSEQNRWLNS